MNIDNLPSFQEFKKKHELYWDKPLFKKYTNIDLVVKLTMLNIAESEIIFCYDYMNKNPNVQLNKMYLCRILEKYENSIKEIEHFIVTEFFKDNIVLEST